MLQPNNCSIFVMHNHVKVSKLMIYRMIKLISLQCNDTGHMFSFELQPIVAFLISNLIEASAPSVVTINTVSSTCNIPLLV